jgi:hypothetical protein
MIERGIDMKFTRTVSTVEELDALPVGAVVRTAVHGSIEVAEKWRRDSWYFTGDPNPFDGATLLFVVTSIHVLYDPDTDTLETQ